MTHSPPRLLLRICSGRVVPPDTTTHPTLTVDDVRSLSSHKLTASDSLHRALLLQNALGVLEARPGAESFRDPEMNPWGRGARKTLLPPSPPAADPTPEAFALGGKRAAAASAAFEPVKKARRFAPSAAACAPVFLPCP
jgi:hypothetical protein